MNNELIRLTGKERAYLLLLVAEDGDPWVTQLRNKIAGKTCRLVVRHYDAGDVFWTDDTTEAQNWIDEREAPADYFIDLNDRTPR